MTLRFESVSKSFATATLGRKNVLEKISFEVMRGEILFILGRSGMGKSVTLKTLVGMLKPDSGQVYVDDYCVNQANEKALAEIRSLCGMVFQHPALLDSLTVMQNISFGLQTPQFIQRRLQQGLSALTSTEIKKICLEKMAVVNLTAEILDKYPPEISYGMQKRVSLARTLAPSPRYLLFDEPTTGLDPITTHAVNDLILNLSRQLQVTSVVVSHDMGSALAIADRILVLDQGKIVELDTVNAIKKSRHPLIQDFLHEVMQPKRGDA